MPIGKWYISYKLPSVTGDKLQVTGPYAFEDEAYNQWLVVKSYQGVKDAMYYKEIRDDDEAYLEEEDHY